MSNNVRHRSEFLVFFVVAQLAAPGHGGVFV